MSHEKYEIEAQSLIQAHIAQMRGLKFADVVTLPEAAGEEKVVAGHKCQLTVYVQRIFSDKLLVTVQVAPPGLLGIVSFHTERGLIFSPNGNIREATS